MKSQIEAMRPVATQVIRNNPIFIGDEKDAPCVNCFIERGCRLAREHVEIGRAQPLDESSLRDWLFWLATAISGLIQTINGDGVVCGGAFEPDLAVSLAVRIV